MHFYSFIKWCGSIIGLRVYIIYMHGFITDLLWIIPQFGFASSHQNKEKKETDQCWLNKNDKICNNFCIHINLFPIAWNAVLEQRAKISKMILCFTEFWIYTSAVLVLCFHFQYNSDISALNISRHQYQFDIRTLRMVHTVIIFSLTS